MLYDKKGSDWMTSLERLLPLDVRHAFRFRLRSRIFVVNSWVMNYDSYDHWSHDSEGHVITDHVINVFSVIKKHNFDFSITTRMEDPTLKILELIRQSNFHNFWSGIQEPLVGPFRTSSHIWNDFPFFYEISIFRAWTRPISGKVIQSISGNVIP